MTEPGQLPEGFSVDAVDWLPSGAKSGLVRVRGHRPAAVAGPLPELILEAGDTTRRYVSLPDPRADRDPTAWRGAYVLEARPVAEADHLWLEWPGSRRIALPALSVPQAQVARASDEGSVDTSEVVVDRAVLAERRARRAEASEQAQAKISREALRAVEVLEMRIAELEQRTAAAEGERDALRGQAQPDVDNQTLTAELAALRARLAERPAPAAEPSARIAPGEAERRAERLRTALTATVTTVGELRLRLHEVQVARRTRDLSAAADAVRLAVVERERGALKAAMDEARLQLERAVAARDEAVAELQGVRNAHDDLRHRFGDVSAELGTARERIAELESEVAAVTAVAERSASEALEAARAEASALATEHAHDTEAQMEALRARLAVAESSIAAAETARELAEARALAATTGRYAAAVAQAATPQAPERVAQASNIPTKATQPRMPEALIAPEREPEPTQIAADLDAARAALRAVEPADPAPSVPEDPEPASDPDPERRPATIISATGDLPNDIARGRSTREYPPLRGALVKLAHDDPAAAGRILAGFLKAQHAAVTESPPDYDLTITEVGTFAVSPAGQTTLVNPLEEPRGRPHAAFHLTLDALTLAESVSGVAAKARRLRGPVRVTGKARAARRLTESLRQEASLADLLSAGAELDPHATLRGFAYAVRPAWTQGQQWQIDLHVDDAVFAIAAQHTGGLTVREGVSDGAPDASLKLTAATFRDLVAGNLPEPAVEGDERVVRRLLTLAERARTGAD